MVDDNRTRVIYEILADFSSLSRNAREARREIAQLKATEDAFNASSQKNQTKATNAAKARQKAVTAENATLKTLVGLINRRATAEAKAAAATRVSTKAIQAESRALDTNAKRLVQAAEAARAYAAAQRAISRNTVRATEQIRENSPVQQSRPTTTRQPRFYPDPTPASNPAADRQAAASNQRRAESVNLLARAMQFLGRTNNAVRAAEEALNRAQERHNDASLTLAIAEQRLADLRARLPEGSASVMQAELRVARARRAAKAAADDLSRAQERLRRETSSLVPTLRAAEGGGNRLYRAFEKFGNWRPRLVPPFVALIPVIASVIAVINPLIALIGAAGAATFGFASNLASLSGVALALPGIFSGVIGGIMGIIAAMGGVGNVFKTYGAMQKAAGLQAGAAGAAGESAAERADRLARAELTLARAHRTVQKAQENLTKSRERALQNIIDLRREVERASITEERALADLLRARDNYNNVMADPASQAGDKADAAVAIKEAEQELEDVRRRNIEAANELREAERRGVEGSEEVIEAKENLQDALISEREAQRDLQKETTGTTAATNQLATATNEYEEALAKLSPSARTVVLALIAMKDNWEAMKRSVQEEFFGPIVGELDHLPSIIETIGNVLRPSARAMGEFVAQFLDLVDSPQWRTDLAKIGGENEKVLGNLGRGALALATFFKDLILAAAPFTDWLTGSFADGMENLSELLDTEPEKNGLAAWLDVVRRRLQKWGDIVGNVASTLFNYGKAAGDFGDWISDNLVKMTGNWKKNSQDAARDGSEFQDYLVRIRPLLSDFNSLLGKFFGWMRQEFFQQQNINDARAFVKVIRDDLGPALGRLLDALAMTNIDVKIVSAISSIATSLTELINAGGGQAFETFADVVTGFFRGLADVLSGLRPGDLAGLLGFVGALAGLSFIGKFTGITNMVGGLLSLLPVIPQYLELFKSMRGSRMSDFLGGLAKAGGAVSLVAALAAGLQAVVDAIKTANSSSLSEVTQEIQQATSAAEAFRDVKVFRGLAYGTSGPILDDMGKLSGILDKMASYKDEPWGWLRKGFEMDPDFNGFVQGWATFGQSLADIVNSGDIDTAARQLAAIKAEGNLTNDQIYTLISSSDALMNALRGYAGGSVDFNDHQAVVQLALGGTKSKMDDVASAAESSEDKISRLRSELELLGGGARDQNEAIDRLADSISAIGDLPELSFSEIENGDTAGGRQARSLFRQIEEDARAAATAILENGGSVEEAQGKYETARQSIQDYLTGLGMGPDAARAFADSQLGPADEVIGKLQQIKAEQDKIERDVKIKFEMSGGWLGGSKDTDKTDKFGNPTTIVDGKEVVDFGAMGSSTSPFGIADKLKIDLDSAQLNWDNFKTGFGRSVSAQAQANRQTNFGVNDALSRDGSAATLSWQGTAGRLVDTTAGAARDMKTRGTDPMRNDSISALDAIRNNGLNPFQNQVGGLPGVFNTVVSGIATAWERLRATFRGPIDFVINEVYNKGIRGFWNPISDRLNLGMRLDPAPGFKEGGVIDRSVLPGYMPGTDNHHFVDQNGLRLDLGGGEGILIPQATRMLGGEKGVRDINRKAKSGQAFKEGGVFQGMRAPRKPGTGGVLELAGELFDQVAPFLSNPLKVIRESLANTVKGGIDAVANNFGNSDWVKMAAAFPKRIVDRMAGIGTERAKDVRRQGADDISGGGPAPGNVMGWRAQWAAVKAAFPSATLNSAYRPGAVTVNGGASYHGMGRAIDVNPSPAIFNWLKQNYPNSRELIYSPMGGQQLQNGREFFWGGAVRATHWDHVHWAMKDGGVFNPGEKVKGTHDRGGELKHGMAALNLSGKPEAVLTNPQWELLKDLVNARGISAPVPSTAGLSRSVGSLQGTSTTVQTIDQRTIVEKVEVINPLQEKMSESLPKAIRRIGYAKNARNNAAG